MAYENDPYYCEDSEFDVEDEMEFKRDEEPSEVQHALRKLREAHVNKEVTELAAQAAHKAASEARNDLDVNYWNLRNVIGTGKAVVADDGTVYASYGSSLLTFTLVK